MTYILNSEERTMELEEAVLYRDDFGMVVSCITGNKMYFMVVYEAGVEDSSGYTYPKKGLYIYEKTDRFFVTTIKFKEPIAVENVKPIDKKYLPESLQFGEEAKIEMKFPESELEFAGEPMDGYYSSPTIEENMGLDAFRNAEKIVAYFDGEPFECAYSETLGSGSGAVDKYVPVGTDSFFFGILAAGGFLLVASKTEGWHSFGVGLKVVSVKPVDPKYLPVPTITSPNGTVYTLTVDDEGNLSATVVIE